MAFAIITYGDAQGGSRDDYRIVTEEEARAHDPEASAGWTQAVRIEILPLDEPSKSASGAAQAAFEKWLEGQGLADLGRLSLTYKAAREGFLAGWRAR